MVVYELTHLFCRHADELLASAKSLGFYPSFECVKQAIEYYSLQPGFCDNQEFFSAKERRVNGIENDATLLEVLEVIVYIHSEDYEIETEIELGLFGVESAAQAALIKYCSENSTLLSAQNLIVEKIVNRRKIGKREWTEGFSFFD